MTDSIDIEAIPLPPSIQISCPAKVNLALSVGSPDEAGMHPIASWMVAVNFSDALLLEKINADHSAFEIRFEENATLDPSDDHPTAKPDVDSDAETPEAAPPAASPGPAASQPIGIVDWPLEKDLCFRAHALLERHLNRPLPCRLRLRKRIPAGAGLGGGSSNAAHMLVALDRLFDLHVHPGDLIELSRELGSDVAFSLGVARGIPSAIVTGLGEQLTPAPRKGVIDLVLILPPFGCPTGAVYQAFDRLHQFTPGQTDAKPVELKRVEQLVAMTTLPQHAPFNDLAQPACIVQPQLGEAKSQLEAALKLPVHITGSGSTLFLIAPTALTAKVLARKVVATTGLRAVATRTL